jgi:hypothetical protein
MATEAPLSRDERLDANLRRHDALLSDALGCGVRGTVFVLERQRATGRMRSAVKFHEHREPYLRERDCYLRLWDHQVDEILGHQVPQLINFDDDLLAIEMTIVVRPFVLDFGGAYLDMPPDYDEEILDEWRRDKEEQFEHNWPAARSILYALEKHGIYVIDVNPGNIAFVETSGD